jgi:hypothetical protein
VAFCYFFAKEKVIGTSGYERQEYDWKMHSTGSPFNLASVSKRGDCHSLPKPNQPFWLRNDREIAGEFQRFTIQLRQYIITQNPSTPLRVNQPTN